MSGAPPDRTDAAPAPTGRFARLGPPPGARLLLMGGAGGIGQALTRAACALGMQVANVDLPAAIERLPAPGPAGVRHIGADARDAAALERALDEAMAALGGVDHFVHLAGYTVPPTRAQDLTLAEWDAMLEVNLRSAFVAARRVCPALAQAAAQPGAADRGAGSAVLLSSGLGVTVEQGFAAYSASKAGLIALARVLAKEHAPAVRVNVVAPGAVDTAFLSGGTARGGEPGMPGWFHRALGPEVVNRTIPLQRIAQPDDVVGPVLFLLGPASGYMTGQTLFVSGGRHM